MAFRGTGGLVNLWHARAEVRATGVAGLRDAPAVPDEVSPAEVPSVARLGSGDRVLAEIDHDGFAFARAPEDEPFFNRRAEKHPRQQHLLDVVLHGGRVCVRKRFRRPRRDAVRFGDRPVPAREWAQRSLWVTLKLPLYNEAAALLRLRDLPFVPKLRGLDAARNTLTMDYLRGESLRHLAAAAGAPVHDADLRGARDLAGLGVDELDAREIGLLDRGGGAGDYRAEIAAMARAVNARGVAPLDIKLGNFMRGEKTGQLYWIDFEISRLASQPRWQADLGRQRDLLRRLFGVEA